MKALLALLFISQGAAATTLRAYLYNREGVKHFEEKSYFPAYQSFLKALEEDPLNPQIHLNMARSFEANEEYDKAEGEYKGVLKIVPENSPTRFEALFNLGGVLGKQSKIDEALAAYQAALDMVPDSKEVKSNIELLWQQGGGQGKGQNKDQKDQQGKNKQKEGEGQDKDQKKNQNQDQQEQKQQPKPFQSQELTPQDVKKILDEIKNQEQAIRAQEYERNTKEAPRGKDW